MKKTIVVANNHWANIGDAFYQLPIIADLQAVYGEEAEVFSGEEFPVHALSRWGGRKSSFLNYSLYTVADWYVISGPVIDPGMPARFEELFTNLKARGVKIVFISVGSNHYDEKEIDACRNFLKKYPPYILSTRDSQTYQIYADLAEYSYDGICSAYYSSIHYSGYDTSTLGKYIVLGFESSTEPKIILQENDIQNIAVERDSLRDLSAVGLLLDNLRTYPETIGDFRIIRPLHHPLAKMSLFAYNRPNKFVSMNPYGYLNIYRNTEITISQRVHACVVTLSYQKPAMLIKKTKRSALFDRLELSDITEHPVTLSKDRIIAEHHAFISFLKNVPL